MDYEGMINDAVHYLLARFIGNNEACDKIINNNKTYSDFEQLNILVVGKTGSGAHTFLNKYFGQLSKYFEEPRQFHDPLEKTEYKHKKRPFTISYVNCDNDSQKNLKFNTIARLFEENNNIFKCVLFCMDSQNNNFTNDDTAFFENIPETTIPFVIMTKSTRLNLLQTRLQNRDMIFVSVDSSHSSVSKNGFKAVQNTLRESTILTQGQKRTLRSVTNFDISYYNKWAVLFMIGGSAGCGGLAAMNSSPFSDAIVLCPAQILLYSTICCCYEIPLYENFVHVLISSFSAYFASSTLGKNSCKWLKCKNYICSIAKCLPYVGNYARLIEGLTACGTTGFIAWLLISDFNSLVSEGQELNTIKTSNLSTLQLIFGFLNFKS